MKKLLCFALLCCCMISPNEDVPQPQIELDERIQIRDVVKKKNATEEKIWLAYYSGLYQWSKKEEGK